MSYTAVSIVLGVVVAFFWLLASQIDRQHAALMRRLEAMADELRQLRQAGE